MAAPVKRRDIQREIDDRSSDDDDYGPSGSKDNGQNAMEEEVTRFKRFLLT